MEQPDRPKNVERTPLYTFARLVMKAVFAVIYPLKAYNREQLDRDAPFIIVANHSSMLDPLAIAVHCRRYEIRFMGKKELTKNPVLAWIVRRLHMFTVDRHTTDIKAMRAAVDTLRKGHVLGIFPEGTRRPPEALMDSVESGVSLIALRANVPLIPVYIDGRISAFRRNRLVVGEPIVFDDILAQGVNRASCDALTARIAHVIRNLRDETRDKN